jgi:hypothetical protein
MKTEVTSKPTIEILNKTEEVRVPPGELGAVLELTVRNREGEVTRRQEMLSESFVKQFLQLLWVSCVRVSSGYRIKDYRVKDVDGNLDPVQVASASFQANAGPNVDTYGILVGTGTTAPTIDDYQMETKIPHGTGAGQLQYSAVAFGAPTSDGTVSHFTITRDFSNASGGPITVREVGLVVYFQRMGSGSGYYLTIRDAVNITIPDGETLTVNYRLQGTV